MSEDEIEDVPIGAPSPSPYEDDADLPDADRSDAGISDADLPDFADEHADTTVGDGEDSRETESPRGIGGMDTPPNPARDM